MKINCQNNIYISRVGLAKVKDKDNVNISPDTKSFQGLTYAYYHPVSFKSTPYEKRVNADTFFDEIKYMNAKVWVPKKDSSGCEPVSNPIAEPYLKALDDFNYTEKGTLVEKFMKMTGFPNPKLIKTNMENEAINAIAKLGKENGFKPLLATYTNSCSVGQGMPLPGCDMDGLVFLIDTEKKDECGFYRWQLSQKINQRILATGADHLPEILTLKQAKESIKLAESIFSQIEFSDAEIADLRNSIANFDPDFTKAADFNMKIIQHPIFENEIKKSFEADNSHQDFQSYRRQYKYDFLGICMMLENYRQKSSNSIFNNLDKETKNLFENSCLYKYSNITQQKALMPHVKDKLKNRCFALKQFDRLSPEEQFEFVKVNIYNSFGIAPQEGNPFKELFGNSGANTFDLNPLVEMYSNLIK